MAEEAQESPAAGNGENAEEQGQEPQPENSLPPDGTGVIGSNIQDTVDQEDQPETGHNDSSAGAGERPETGISQNDGAEEAGAEPSRSPQIQSRAMTLEERRNKRAARLATVPAEEAGDGQAPSASQSTQADIVTESTQPDEPCAMRTADEDQLIEVVASVNRLYQEVLNCAAPFVTFLLIGMQSSTKSTILERFLKAVMNVVHKGTGTRCPLDVTCIHDEKCLKPECELRGKELAQEKHGKGLSADETFQRVTEHNQELKIQDKFSNEHLYLEFGSAKVQNLRIVDPPGVLLNKSTGKDNREDIKKLLSKEMQKPNVKLCVLLDSAQEFGTNSIVRFCDETLGRDKWFGKAIFLMTKFDLMLHETRTVSRAHHHFKEYFDNNCKPYLVISPTLEEEDMTPTELFQARTTLIESANDYEKEMFAAWLQDQKNYSARHGGDFLDARLRDRLGFPRVKQLGLGILCLARLELLNMYRGLACQHPPSAEDC